VQGKQGFEPGCIHPKLGQQREVKIGIPCEQNEPRNRRYASERHVGRTKREPGAADRSSQVGPCSTWTSTGGSGSRKTVIR
jgi:hypothetical protein